MPVKTRAAVVRERGGPFAFEEIELDDPRPDEVLVRIVACGICHTDVAARDGLIGVDFPAVLGHEGAGAVEKVGANVGRVRAGSLSMLGISADAPGEQISPQKPSPGQRVFYSIAGDSNPQKFIPFLIEAFRKGKFPVDALVRQYPASRINEGVRDSLSGLVVKPVLRF